MLDTIVNFIAHPPIGGTVGVYIVVGLLMFSLVGMMRFARLVKAGVTRPDRTLAESPIPEASHTSTIIKLH